MISLEVAEKLGPRLVEKIARATEVNRTRISRAMASEVRAIIVAKLTELGETRHATANRLGGEETGYIRQLAENFDQASTVSVDDNGVSLQLRHPIFKRAFHDVTIVPVNAEFLTIPINARAYGHRVGEFDKFILIKEGGHRQTSEKKRKPIPDDLPVFYLVKSVTQRQDRSLFPSGDEINTAAALGATNEVHAIIAEAKAGA